MIKANDPNPNYSELLRPILHLVFVRLLNDGLSSHIGCICRRPVCEEIGFPRHRSKGAVPKRLRKPFRHVSPDVLFSPGKRERVRWRLRS